MRNMIRIAVSVVLVGLVGCSGDTKVDQGEMSSRAENKATKEGAETGGWKDGGMIPSDIKILKVHKNGSGEACGLGKTATLAYKAMLANGDVLDPGTRPFTFEVGLGRAIKGWDIVVAKMKVGDSFTILLPEALAYGPSKGDLKFDMELLSFK
jgi:FKBP-type peptidyl-prolyl cis-trans isomerase